jgi:hypothetical protein
MEEFENSYKNLVGKRQERGALVTRRRRWRDNAEIGPNKWGVRVWTGFNQVRIQSNGGLWEHGNTPWGSIKARNFFNSYHPFQNDRGLT